MNAWIDCPRCHKYRRRHFPWTWLCKPCANKVNRVSTWSSALETQRRKH